MQSDLNLFVILIPDGFAVLLMVIVYQGNYRILREDDRRNPIIRAMMMVIIMTCLMDGLSVLLETKGLPETRFLAIIANNWIILANVIIGWLWIYLVSHSLELPVQRFQRLFMILMFLVGVVLQIINLFVPIIFEVDVNCIYHRKAMFWVCPTIGIIYIIDGLLILALAKIQGGILKFFPFKEMIFPILVGIVIQVAVFGVSTIWPGMALSVAALVFSIQNETLFRDQLTGLYNRFYLDNLKEEAVRQRNKKSRLTIVMFDLNDFKSINDHHGHSMGDEALITFSEILTHYIGSVGTVIRYAGDEFVVVLNTHSEQLVKSILRRVKGGLDEFNRQQHPYKLSASYGYYLMDLKEQSIDEIMNEVDKKMYEDKKRFYMMNPYL